MHTRTRLGAAWAALLLASLALPGATPAVIEIDGAPTEGCTAPSTNVTKLVSESPWKPSPIIEADGTIINGLVKEFMFSFGPEDGGPSVLNTPHVNEEEALEAVLTSQPLVTFDDGDGTSEPGEAPDVDVKDCSAGTCAVQVHVYEKSTQSVKGGVGFLGFLPFFFGVGGYLKAEQEVNVTQESKIECSGMLWTTVVATGGIGPMTAASTILESNAKQQHQTCSYTNIPKYNDKCEMTYRGNFELAATHPGEYTRFDVVNGGRFTMAPYHAAASTLTSTWCTPDTVVMPGLCLGTSGVWMTKFAAIEIKVDSEEAVALLTGGGGSLI
jgi:hypothetical protein